MLKTLDHICSGCGKEVYGSDITLDHILPVSLYPDLRLDPTNIQVMCRDCNSRKQDRIAVRLSYFNEKYVSGF